jgi:hypothetical protein
MPWEPRLFPSSKYRQQTPWHENDQEEKQLAPRPSRFISTEEHPPNCEYEDRSDKRKPLEQCTPHSHILPRLTRDTVGHVPSPLPLRGDNLSSEKSGDAKLNSMVPHETTAQNNLLRPGRLFCAMGESSAPWENLLRDGRTFCAVGDRPTARNNSPGRRIICERAGECSRSSNNFPPRRR